MFGGKEQQHPSLLSRLCYGMVNHITAQYAHTHKHSLKPRPSFRRLGWDRRGGARVYTKFSMPIHAWTVGMGEKGLALRN